MAAQRVLLLSGGSTSGLTSPCSRVENPVAGPFLLEHSERLGSAWGLQCAAGAEAGSRGSHGDVVEGSSLREEPTVLRPPDLAGNHLLFNQLLKRLEVKLEATSLKACVLGLASGVLRHLGFSGVSRAWRE